MKIAGLLKAFQELQAYNRNTLDNEKYFMENNILKDVGISNFLCIFSNFLLPLSIKEMPFNFREEAYQLCLHSVRRP